MAVVMESRIEVELQKKRREPVFQRIRQAFCPAENWTNALSRLAAAWGMEAKDVANLQQGKVSIGEEEIEIIRASLERVADPPPGLIELIDLSTFLSFTDQERSVIKADHEQAVADAAIARGCGQAAVEIPLLPHIVLLSGTQPNEVDVIPVREGMTVRIVQPMEGGTSFLFKRNLPLES